MLPKLEPIIILFSCPRIAWLGQGYDSVFLDQAAVLSDAVLKAPPSPLQGDLGTPSTAPKMLLDVGCGPSPSTSWCAPKPVAYRVTSNRALCCAAPPQCAFEFGINHSMGAVM